MSATAVWSERNELHAASLRDCAYSACLTALVFGGWRGYPLGQWTAEEREALERSDDQPDETGANVYDLDIAVRRRYALRLHPMGADDTLGELLQTPAMCLIVAGSYAGLPLGHTLRRWQPAFTGSHMVAVTTGASPRWFDPLAPNQYAGDPVSVADALRFAYGPPNVRIVFVDEYADFNPPPTDTEEPVVVPGPVVLYFDPDERGTMTLKNVAGGVGFIRLTEGIVPHPGSGGDGTWGVFGKGWMQAPIQGHVYLTRVNLTPGVETDEPGWVKADEAYFTPASTTPPTEPVTTLESGHLYRAP